LEFAVLGHDEQTSMITAEVDGQRVLLKGHRPAGRSVRFSIRPEWIRVVETSRPGDQNILAGTVVSSSFLGSMVRYRVTGPGGQVLTIEVHHPDEAGIHADGDAIRYQIPPDRPVILPG